MNWEPMMPTRTFRFIVLLFELPIFPIFVMQKIVRLRNVCDLELRAVPVQLLTAIANAQRAQKHRLGQRSREVKIRPRRRATLASLNPFLVMADRAWERCARPFVFLVPSFRYESRLF